MTHLWTHARVREPDLCRLADLLAIALRPGDVVALKGDLGAGKTTLCRYLIRVLLNDANAEVPSPTFSLLQTYATPRFMVFHFDLYRLGRQEEAAELGIGEETAHGVTLIEWPDRVEGLLPADRWEIELSDVSDEAERRVVIAGHGACAGRVARLAAMDSFLRRSGWANARLSYMQGDASPRRFARVHRDGATAVLMDAPPQADGPPVRDGLPYSRIAHIAEDVRPYVAVAGALQAAGCSAPAILAYDLELGLLLTEDLGDAVYSEAVAKGTNQSVLWQSAVDVLVHLRRLSIPQSLPLPDGSSYRVPAYNHAALQIETELLVDWYWPAAKGSAAPAPVRADFCRLWSDQFDWLGKLPTGWVLRDFHSPNLMWLPGRSGIRRTGILDFQDALNGNPAYDLVSLLQDARIDVSPALESGLIDRYCMAVRAADPGFDRDSFAAAYAILGAQRNTKILGIFTRLAKRDGKTHYLRHIPRIWHYLERNLEHATLRPLKGWYDAHLPREVRKPPIGG